MPTGQQLYPSGEEQEASFSIVVGLLYFFNLIVGTGALALPKAFQTAGYVLSILLLIFSAIASYICATFIIESMAIANASTQRRPDRNEEERSVGEARRVYGEIDGAGEGNNEAAFEIKRRVEVSEMAHMFLGRKRVLFTYFALTVYLFGDLAIYSATVPKSLMNIICAPCHHTDKWPHFLTRSVVYRLCVLLFISFCLPMVLIGMTKMKALQLATTLSRWLAFLLMITLASIQLAQDGPKASPPLANVGGFGSLFGVAVYAFMCHHSIPGLVTPIRDKSFICYKLLYVYGLVFLFYCTLSLTGSFAFSHVQDVYTLNFLHDEQTGGLLLALCDYFLALFPVFTLTSSYIIVAITLSNNARVLLRMVEGGEEHGAVSHSSDESEALIGGSSDEDGDQLGHNPTTLQLATNSQLWNTLLIPVCVVILPAVISLFTDNVLFLASITGSYPGVSVQFLIPSMLIIEARRRLARTPSIKLPEKHSSPFAHWGWPYVTIGWAVLAIVAVTANLIHS